MAQQAMKRSPAAQCLAVQIAHQTFDTLTVTGDHAPCELCRPITPNTVCFGSAAAAHRWLPARQPARAAREHHRFALPPGRDADAG
jgi:hypothetical protein